jgi:hypothetical protein
MFDSREEYTQPEARDFSPIPAGPYTVTLEEQEPGQSQSGGQYIRAVFVVADGDHANRKIFEYFNLVNANEEVEQRSKGLLKNFCDAVGVAIGGSTIDEVSANLNEAMNAEVTAKVWVQKEKPGSEYGPQNRIESFQPAGGSSKPKFGTAKKKPAFTR